MKNVSIGELGRIRVDAYKCERCGHIWLPSEITKQQNRKPVVCAKCKSAYWDIPRSRSVESKK
jgi:DNA-directed RNA polymerase subunit RPC12/RpoP